MLSLPMHRLVTPNIVYFMIKINQAIKLSRKCFINPGNNHIDPGPTRDSAGCIGLASYRLCQPQKYLVLSQNLKFTRPNFPAKI